MQKRIELDANSYEEALELAVEKLHVSSDRLFVNEISDNKYEALLDVSLALEGKKYIESILDNLGVDYNIEVRTLNGESELHFIVDSSENPLLIGIKGRTLDALQVLLKKILRSMKNGQRWHFTGRTAGPSGIKAGCPCG